MICYYTFAVRRLGVHLDHLKMTRYNYWHPQCNKASNDCGFSRMPLH